MYQGDSVHSNLAEEKPEQDKEDRSVCFMGEQKMEET